MGVVGETEWVYGVLADGIYAEGTIRYDWKGMVELIGFLRYGDSRYFRLVDCVLLRLKFDFDMCGGVRFGGLVYFGYAQCRVSHD